MSLHNTYLKDVLRQFPSLFTELGICHNFKAKFNLTDNARPVQIPCRQIVFAMENLLEEELKRLESNNIIGHVDTSNWTSPIVIAKKQNGKIRLCANYSTRVNSVLISNRHSLPSVESIILKLNGSCFFSLIDLRDAFFQIENPDRRESPRNYNHYNAQGTFQILNAYPLALKQHHFSAGHWILHYP